MEEGIIEFNNYIKKFRTTVVGPLNFSFEKGKTVALLGASGSGKSVVIKSIIGAITRYKGQIKVCGFSKKKWNSYKANKFISFYTQMEFSLCDMTLMTYLKNMCIVLGVRKKDIKEKINYWLDFFDLKKDANKKVKNFSWGMQNRLSLIICGIKDAEVVILDEPGANLDSGWRNKMRNLLIKYKEMGKTILITSHNIDEINDLIDYYVILEDGTQVFAGSKLDLNMYTKYKIYFYEDFDYEPFQEFLRSKNIKVFEYDKLEKSIVFATNTTKEINWIFLYLIKVSTPIQNLVKLPVNMDSIYKALKDKEKKENSKIVENASTEEAQK
ncbi:ABC transporter ATP-binding protein [Spiroplasma helicoides]|uniref:ABC transporter ATP-binding protein n=1 Tax=Spiroplasma helicoides TaxID=216938 RepID=A0A1B3SJH9_9MOLU|nr:ABC transporter ATP-binding protein [Spiroplasma helicoides]AOG60082.1 ABC transporter ATP-binding protein [Spiroplasma helicoides]